MAQRFTVLPLRTKDSTVVRTLYTAWLHPRPFSKTKLCVRKKIITFVQKTILEDLRQYWAYCYATEIIDLEV